MKPREAYAFAASRMSGPVIAATLTRIAAFSPLLFWPGIVGQFMGYLPLTLIATLSASLVAALIFTPTLGALVGKAARGAPRHRAASDGAYIKTVRLAIRHPGHHDPARLRAADRRADRSTARSARASNSSRTSSRTSASCWSMRAATSRSPRRTGWCARSRRRSSTWTELSTVYARSGDVPARAARTDVTEDVIGQIQFEFVDWQKRRPAGEIMDEIRDDDRRHPRHQGRGDGAERRAADRQADPDPALQRLSRCAARRRRCRFRRSSPSGRRSATSTTACRCPASTGGWRSTRRRPPSYGIGVGSVGSVVQLVTNGLKITDYRPQIQRQAGRHHPARAGRPADAEPDRRPADPDRGRLGADRQLHQARAGAAHRHHQPRRRQARHHRHRQRRRRRADRRGAGRDHQAN